MKYDKKQLDKFGSGTLGRVVAYDSRKPDFKSSQWQFFYSTDKIRKKWTITVHFEMLSKLEIS